MNLEKKDREAIWLIAFDYGTVGRAVAKAMTATQRITGIIKEEGDSQHTIFSGFNSNMSSHDASLGDSTWMTGHSGECKIPLALDYFHSFGRHAQVSARSTFIPVSTGSRKRLPGVKEVG